MKIGRKFIFHPCEADILDRLHITVLYTFFWDFEEHRVSAQYLKTKELAFSFTEKRLFVTKTDRKSILHLSEAHILARLDIRVLVLKNSEFWLKTKRISLWFYWQMSVHGKNWSKSIFHPCEAHILSWLDITKIYTFFGEFEKHQVSAQNQKGITFGFTEKHLFATKLVENPHFIPTRSIFLLD
jgi:hypothetical protein